MAQSNKIGANSSQVHGRPGLRSTEEFALRGSAVKSGKKENLQHDGRDTGEGPAGEEELANPNLHYGSQAAPAGGAGSQA